MTTLQSGLTQREQLKQLLQSNVLSVVFLKKDGTERVLECTLRADLLPVHETNTNNPIDFPVQARAENLEVLQVYDVENNGWRSFRLDSVIAFMVRENGN